MLLTGLLMDLFSSAWVAQLLATQRSSGPLPLPSEVLKKWRKLTLRVLRVIAAAFFQHLSSDLLVLAGLSKEAAHRTMAVNLEPHALRLPASQPATTWRLGERLTNSKASGIAECAVDRCDHPIAARRNGGNGYASWTMCRKCHGRWERLPVPAAASSQDHLRVPAAASSQDHLASHTPAASSQDYPAYDSDASSEENVEDEAVVVPTPACRACHVDMVAKRNSSNGALFWGCPNAPRCKETRGITVNGITMLTAPTVVDMSRGDDNEDFTIA